MVKMNPEIIIYIQNFKRHLKNFPDSMLYFIPNEDLEYKFFLLLEEYAIKQYNETGQPHLTKEQLEEIRLKLTNINSPFQNIGKWGVLCLN